MFDSLVIRCHDLMLNTVDSVLNAKWVKTVACIYEAGHVCLCKQHWQQDTVVGTFDTIFFIVCTVNHMITNSFHCVGSRLFYKYIDNCIYLEYVLCYAKPR